MDSILQKIQLKLSIQGSKKQEEKTLKSMPSTIKYLLPITIS